MLTRKTAKLSVNQLEDRWNPAPMAHPLTTPGAQAQIYEGIFRQFDGPSLSQLDTFVSMDSNVGEQGYNTNLRPLQFDEINADTHAIQRNDLPLVNIEISPGVFVAFREFVLDVQEGNNATAKLISLDDLKVFVAPVGNLGNLNVPASILDFGGSHQTSAIYDMSREFLDPNNPDPADHWVVLDGKLSGKMSTDMLFYLPDSLFGAVGDNPFVYLYSRFGTNNATEGKAESWARGLNGVPAGPFAAGTISGTDLGGTGSTTPTPPVSPPPPPPSETGSGDGTVWL